MPREVVPGNIIENLGLPESRHHHIKKIDIDVIGCSEPRLLPVTLPSSPASQPPYGVDEPAQQRRSLFPLDTFVIICLGSFS